MRIPLLAFAILALLVPAGAWAIYAGGNGWHAYPIGNPQSPLGVGPLGCPTQSFCLGPGTSGSLVSGNPLGGTSAWKQTPNVLPVQTAGQGGAVGNYARAIACPSSHLCAIVYIAGSVATSASPTAGGKWNVARISPGYLYDVACPTRNLCVAAGARGVLRSPDPTGGPAAWRTVSHVATRAIACPSIKLCVALGTADEILSTTNPTSAHSHWREQHLPQQDSGLALLDISCASNHLCVVADGNSGVLLTSTNPGGAASAWKPSQPLAGQDQGLLNISCVPSRLCIASEQADGTVIVSTNPAGGKRSWKAEHIAPGTGGVTALCKSTSLCLALDSSGYLYFNTHPTHLP